MFVALELFHSSETKHNPKFKSALQVWDSPLGNPQKFYFSKQALKKRGEKIRWNLSIVVFHFNMQNISLSLSWCVFFFWLQEYFTEPLWYLWKTEDVHKNDLVYSKISVFGFNNWSCSFFKQNLLIKCIKKNLYNLAFIFYTFLHKGSHLCTSCNNKLLACNLNLTSSCNLYTFFSIKEFEQYHHVQSFLCLAVSEWSWIPNWF